ncbi:mycothione reductase [Brachybacterium halotolerans subsp. kimchii]|uniref:mycothione reductase n=1 Tax=Brachybacterium halotolerans TaxID=2795215 RepID=UPI001E4C5122|nr:mycothione reductase [Brachybacterium halotolerans]UEJ83821.1 mycothione reductase [Brachybacterium halotolerans subsp. kimchii]
MTHYDIALIGSGSGNSFPGPEFAGRSIAYIDKGVGPDQVFGGTCLNVGCIPTKMFVHTADLAATPADADRFGVSETLDGVDWPAIRDRIFGRIDPIVEGGEAYRRDHEDNANLTLLRGTAHFTGPKALHVDLRDGGSEEVTADTIVLGAGSRPTIPPIEGLADARPQTSDTIMRIDALPASLVILGSGVIALEMAHIFSGLGVRVSLVARSGRVLRAADDDVSTRITELAREQWDVHTDVTTTAVRREDDGGVVLQGTATGDGGEEDVEIRADEILVAVGRRPNSDLLDVAAGGIATADDGCVRVDPFQRALGEDGQVLEGVWAFGDLSDPVQLKHVANHQLRVVRHNVLHPENPERSDTMPVPAGVFTNPQIAMVGLTEREARAQGLDVRIAVQDYSSIAYGWALEDTTGFAKILAEGGTGRILGAHIIGPESTILIQLIIQAMSTGQTVSELARTQYWIHPAMPELIENALLQLTD